MLNNRFSKYNRNTTGRLCICGCNQPVIKEWSYPYNRPVKYRPRHHRRGKMSKEDLAKHRVIWASPEYREKARRNMLGRKRSEETKRKISEGNKGRKLTKKHRKILSLNMKRRWALGLFERKGPKIVRPSS
jgi:hypothetical protein